MGLTEEQAREKWCPMSRQLGTLIGRRDATEDDRTVAMGSQNRGYAMGGALDNCMCLASKCMMWRWLPLMADDAWRAAVVKAADEIGDSGPSRAKAAAHVNANRAQYGLPTKPFAGRCGLAGLEDAS